MKQGGIYNTRRMISTAEAAGIRCVLGHGFGLGVNTMAENHARGDLAQRDRRY